MVDEHEELPEEDPTEWESTEEEEEELVKYDDGQESFTSDKDDFEGINEVVSDSGEDIEGINKDSEQKEKDVDDSIGKWDGEGADPDHIAKKGWGGGEGFEFNSEDGAIEFNPALPGEGKLKNPFKFFKE